MENLVYFALLRQSMNFISSASSCVSNTSVHRIPAASVDGRSGASSTSPGAAMTKSMVLRSKKASGLITEPLARTKMRSSLRSALVINALHLAGAARHGPAVSLSLCPPHRSGYEWHKRQRHPWHSARPKCCAAVFAHRCPAR